jgi:drug/metabolite transporter (DMT)-like permease
MKAHASRLPDYAGLVLLGAIWGGSYIFIRLGGPEFGTLALIGLRVALGAAALAAWAGLARVKFNLKGNLTRLFVLALLNNIVPYLLITDAVQKLNASLGAILNSTTPLFTALVGAVFAGEALGLRKIAGVVLGLAGVAVLMGFSPLEPNPTVLLAAGECLLAALAYGGAAVYARYRIAHIDGMTASFAQLVAASIVIVPLALTSLPAALPSAGAWRPCARWPCCARPSPISSSSGSSAILVQPRARR